VPTLEKVSEQELVGSVAVQFVPPGLAVTVTVPVGVSELLDVGVTEKFTVTL
jgi:hypothetical protein